MLDNLIKSLEDLRDGTYPGTMKAIDIIAHLPDIIAVLRAAKGLRDRVGSMNIKMGFPPQYEPREMAAFRNGWDSNKDKWIKSRDEILAYFDQACEEK